MKTVFRSVRYDGQAIVKRGQFEERTGVKWDFFHTAMGMVFSPIVTKNTPTDEGAADLLYPYLSHDYLGFVRLSEVSGLALDVVLIAAKTLTKQGRAMPGMNRRGNFSSIRLKTRYEK